MTIAIPAESRNLVENVAWETYVTLADGRRGCVPRMTYDQGRMELMSPRKEHENIKSLLARFVVAFAEARDIEIVSVASTTFRREDLGRGFEADDSYYIKHAADVRSKEEIDLSIDPPPDLVIEIEITSSAIRKLDLLAAMGVSEVWRHNGTELSIFSLVDETYRQQSGGSVFPEFPLQTANRAIASRLEKGEIAILKEFRKFLG